MKRLLAAATSAVALVSAVLGAGLASSPAAALDPSTPVYDGLPPGWSFDWVPFATPDYGPFGDYQHVAEAGPTGWGTGALKLVMGPVSGVRLTAVTSLAGLDVATVWVKIGMPAGVAPTLDLSVVVDGDTYVGALPADTAWTQVDLAAVPLEQQASGSSTTLSVLADAHPTTATLTLAADNGYDSGGAFAFVDGWSWTADGVTEAYDFEDPHTPTTCVLTSKHPVIEAGEMADLTGRVLDDHGGGVAGARFDLLVRGWGQPSSRVLMRPLTNSHGSIGMAKLQMRRTEYQMSLPQTVALGRCRSALVVVKVRTKVTMSAPAQAATGRQIEVSGATTPAKPGTAVTLWRVRPGADTRLDRGTVTKNGTYALAAKATTTGVWKVYVKVAAARGNLAGRSPTAAVRVR